MNIQAPPTRRPSPSTPDTQDDDPLVSLGLLMRELAAARADVNQAAARVRGMRHEVEMWASMVTSLKRDVDELLENSRKSAKTIRSATRWAPALLGALEVIRFAVTAYTGGN